MVDYFSKEEVAELGHKLLATPGVNLTTTTRLPRQDSKSQEATTLTARMWITTNT